jgi:hypothetical protein
LEGVEGKQDARVGHTPRHEGLVRGHELDLHKVAVPGAEEETGTLGLEAREFGGFPGCNGVAVDGDAEDPPH